MLHLAVGIRRPANTFSQFGGVCSWLMDSRPKHDQNIATKRSYSTPTKSTIGRASHRLWSKDELDKLGELYSRSVPNREIQKAFPDKSLAAIRSRIHHYFSQETPFPEAEMQIIRDMRSQGRTLVEIQQNLPHRSLTAIKQRIKRAIAHSDSAIISKTS